MRHTGVKGPTEVEGLSKGRYDNAFRKKKRQPPYPVDIRQEIKRGFWFALGMGLFYLISAMLAGLFASLIGISLAAFFS